MSDARSRILSRLKAAPRRPDPPLPEWHPPRFGENRTARFRAMLEASHAEVHDVSAGDWPQRLMDVLAGKGVETLLYAPATEVGRLIAGMAGGPRLVAYDRGVEDLKDTLVHGVDAAVTSTLGGIAETGTLILWPTAAEPRLMSLLPPIHVAVVEEAQLHNSLADAMAAGEWHRGMPTNALLISGPSKTADIEQTLAYGVHGPKELVVLLIRDANA